MKPSLHIIYTSFTGRGLHGGFRGNKWFNWRIEVFKNYTLKSLLNQTNKDFVHWFSFRPDEYYHPSTKALAEYLKSIDYPFVFTFDGQMFWDDKFNDYSFRTMVRNLLMMCWDMWKHKELKNPLKMLKYAIGDMNKTLVPRVARSLEVLKQSTGTDYDWVYLTHLDSDDMFHKDAVTEIQSQEPAHKRALIYLKGYAHDIKTKQFADWKSPVDANPPYHTIIFPGDVFFDAAKHVNYYGGFKSHEDAPRVFNPVYLSDGKYCFTMSGMNISTYWTSYLMKIQNNHIYHEYEGEEKERLLAEFGITTA